MAYWDGTRWAPDPRLSRKEPERRPIWAHLPLAVTVTILLLAVTSGAALARKTTSSVWVDELSGGTGLAPIASLQFGDHFTVGYQTSARKPYALARCYANSTTEYSGTWADGSIWGEVFSVYEGGPTPQDFQLGASVSPLWTGGGADCTVDLVTYSRNLSRMTILATTAFTAAP